VSSTFSLFNSVSGFFSQAKTVLKIDELPQKIATARHYLKGVGDAAKFYGDKLLTEMHHVGTRVYSKMPVRVTGEKYPTVPKIDGNRIFGELFDVLEHGTGPVVDRAAGKAGTAGLSYFWVKTSLTDSKLVLMVKDPAIVKQILIDGVDYTAGYDVTQSFRQVIGESLMDHPVDSPEWKKSRDNYNYLLHRHLRDSERTEAIVAEYVQKAAKTGEYFKAKDFAMCVAMDAIGKAKLGFANFDDAIKRRITPIIEKSMDVLSDPANLLPAFGKVKRFFSAKKTEDKSPLAGKSVKELIKLGREETLKILRANEDHILNTENAISKTLADEEIERHRKKQQGNEPEEKAGMDFHEEQRRRIYDADIVNEVIQIFALGHETTEKLIGFALLVLGEYPEIQDELHRKKGTPEGDILAEAVILEVLRLYPPVPDMKDEIVDPSTQVKPKPGLPKKLTVNFGPGQKQSVQLTPGDLVVVSQWVMHRNEEVYPNAQKFDPKRWIVDPDQYQAGREIHHHRYGKGKVLKVETESKDKTQRVEVQFGNKTLWLNLGEIIRPDSSKFFPFGFGRRLCPGNIFAMDEAKQVVKAVSDQYVIKIKGGRVERQHSSAEDRDKKQDVRETPFPVHRGFNLHLTVDPEICFEKRALEKVAECNSASQSELVRDDERSLRLA